MMMKQRHYKPITPRGTWGSGSVGGAWTRHGKTAVPLQIFGGLVRFGLFFFRLAWESVDLLMGSFFFLYFGSWENNVLMLVNFL